MQFTEQFDRNCIKPKAAKEPITIRRPSGLIAGSCVPRHGLGAVRRPVQTPRRRRWSVPGARLADRHREVDQGDEVSFTWRRTGAKWLEKLAPVGTRSREGRSNGCQCEPSLAPVRNTVKPIVCNRYNEVMRTGAKNA